MDRGTRWKTSEGEPIITKSPSNKILGISWGRPFALAPYVSDPLTVSN